MNSAETLIAFCAVYGLVLVAFGTLSNLLTLFMCLRKNLRSIPTFVFMAFICVMEIVPMYNINLHLSIRFLTGFSIFDRAKVMCIFQYFLHFFPHHTSAWLLVSMNVERYLSIQVKHWRTLKFNSKKALIVSIAIMLAFFFADFVLIFSPKYIEENFTANRTSAYCSVNDEDVSKSTVLSLIHVFVYSFIPFSILLITNSLLIHKVISQKVNIIPSGQNIESKRKNLSKSIIILTISFIIFTGPSAITTGIYNEYLANNSTGIALKYFFSVFRYTYNSFNFFVLLLTNKKFSAEFKYIFNYKQETLLSVRTNNTAGQIGMKNTRGTMRRTQNQMTQVN